jgi:hypothetical protein
VCFVLLAEFTHVSAVVVEVLALLRIQMIIPLFLRSPSQSFPTSLPMLTRIHLFPHLTST